MFDLDLDGDRDLWDRGLMQDGVSAAPERVSLVGNPFAFTGRRLMYYESEPDPNGEGGVTLLANEQLQFNRNRWYDLETSRWLTRDPKGYADGMSLYEYCQSNPTKNTDPMGTDVLDFGGPLMELLAELEGWGQDDLEDTLEALDEAVLYLALAGEAETVNELQHRRPFLLTEQRLRRERAGLAIDSGGTLTADFRHFDRAESQVGALSQLHAGRDKTFGRALASSGQVAGELILSTALEPADWALTLRDAKQDGITIYTAMGLLPIVSGSIGRAARTYDALADAARASGHADLVRYFEKAGVPFARAREVLDRVASGVTSGLKLVPRAGMPVEFVKGRAGRSIPVFGSAFNQANRTKGHEAAILSQVYKMADTGDYEYITLDRAWRTATGRVGSSALRPDIIGVRFDGTVDAWEVISNSDTRTQLLQRLNRGMATLPETRKGQPRLLDPLP